MAIGFRHAVTYIMFTKLKILPQWYVELEMLYELEGDNFIETWKEIRGALLKGMRLERNLKSWLKETFGIDIK